MKNVIKVIILIAVLIVFTSCKSTSNKELNYDNFELSIMIEDDNEYKEYEGTGWPDSHIYAINTAISTCEGGNTVEWDSEKQAIYLTSGTWDKCYAKFDKIIKIESNTDLLELSNIVNNGNSMKGKTITLTSNIEMDSEISGFLPIGYSDDAPFEGNFIGEGNTITVYINDEWIKDNDVKNFGLFGNVKNGTITSLDVNGYIDLSSADAAGIIAATAYNETIIGCRISGYVTGPYDSGNIGGFIGEILEGTTIIKYSSNMADVSGGANLGGLIGYVGNNSNLVTENNDFSGGLTSDNAKHVGGFIGYADDNTTIKINYASSEHYIQAFNMNPSYIGGLIGRSNGHIIIKNSISSGSIDSSGIESISIGGFIGTATSVEISDSQNLDSIKSENLGNYQMNVGGFIGEISAENSKSIIEKCSADGVIMAGNRSGGIIGYVSGKNNSIVINQVAILDDIAGEEDTTYTDGIIVGGLIGNIYNGSTVFILNSFHDGMLLSGSLKSYANGIGQVSSDADNPSTLVILNSYNSGSIASNTISSGVVRKVGPSNIKVNNVYNIGDLVEYASSLELYPQTYSIISNSESENLDIKNAYYQKQSGVEPSNLSNQTGMYVLPTDMNSLMYTLNTNKNSINLGGYGKEIKDLELVDWIMNGDYPTLNI